LKNYIYSKKNWQEAANSSGEN